MEVAAETPVDATAQAAAAKKKKTPNPDKKPAVLTPFTVPRSAAYCVFGDDICLSLRGLDSPNIPDMINLLCAMDEKMGRSESSRVLGSLMHDVRNKLSSNASINKECEQLMFVSDWPSLRATVRKANVDWSSDAVKDTVSAIAEAVIKGLTNAGYVYKEKTGGDKKAYRAAVIDFHRISAIVDVSSNECDRDKAKYFYHLRKLLDAKRESPRKATKKQKRDTEHSSKEEEGTAHEDGTDENGVVGENADSS